MDAWMLNAHAAELDHARAAVDKQLTTYRSLVKKGWQGQ
jgi:hypothetical protein